MLKRELLPFFRMLKKSGTDYYIQNNEVFISDGLNLSTLEANSVHYLPKCLHIEGSLELFSANRSVDAPYTIRLPEHIHCSGFAELSGLRITNKIKTIKAEEIFMFACDGITKLPAKTKTHTLDISASSIVKLSDGAEFRALFARHSSIGSLPKNIRHVTGTLDIERTSIKKLPDSFMVGGSANIAFSNIKDLPKNFRVEGNLHLDEKQAERLAKGVSVGGRVIIYKSRHTLTDQMVTDEWLHADIRDRLNELDPKGSDAWHKALAF